MRSLPNITTALGTATGTEPVVIVTLLGVNHATKSGSIGAVTCTATLVQLGDITSQKTADGLGEISTTNVVLLDTSDTLRTALEAGTLLNATATIYQAYGSSKDLLFTGKVEGPVSWDEGKREVSFDIVSRPSDYRVGTLLDSTILYYSLYSTLVLDPSVKNKYIPFTLGAVENVPAIKLTRQREAVLNNDVNITSHIYTGTMDDSTTVGLRATSTTEYLFYDSSANTWEVPSTFLIEIGGYVIEVQGGIGTWTGSFPQGYLTENISDLNPLKYSTSLATAARDITDDVDYENGKVLWLSDPNKFIEGQFCAIDSCGQWNKCVKQIGRKCWFYGVWSKLAAVTNPDGTHPDVRTVYLPKSGDYINEVRIFSEATGGYAITGDTTQLTLNAGAKVTLWNDGPAITEVWLVNEIASNINLVQGRRTNPISKNETYWPIPNTYYTIVPNWDSNATPLFGHTAITLSAPLSYHNEGWDGNLYVTLRSNTGNAYIDGSADASAQWGNSVSIISYLLQRSGVSFDSTTFNAVAALVANYPMSFTLTEQKNVFDLCQDIAWQARCILRYDGTSVKIKYVSATPSNSGTITSSDIKMRTLIITVPDLFEIATHANVTWRRAFDQYDYTLQSGTWYGRYIKKEINLWAYNQDICAEVSANFWFWRMSHAWLKLEFDIFMQGLVYEVGDTVALTIADELDDHLNLSGSFSATVTEVKYSPLSPSIHLKLEIPCSLGSHTQDTNYYTGLITLISRPYLPFYGTIESNNVVPMEQSEESRKMKHRRDVNTYRRKDGDGNQTGDNTEQLLNNDVLVWDADNSEWIPRPYGYSSGSGFLQHTHPIWTGSF